MEANSRLHHYLSVFFTQCLYYMGIWILLEVGIRLAHTFKLAGNIRGKPLWCRLHLAARMLYEQIQLDISLKRQNSRSSLKDLALISSVVVGIVSILNWTTQLNQTWLILFLFLGVCSTHFRHTDTEGVAIGLAWSYYIGYLQHMLPFLTSDGKLGSFEDENGQKHDIVGWFILVPADGKTPDDIKDKNDRIVFQRQSRPLKKSSGGIKGRTYHLAIYEVQSQDQQRSFYCYMEYAIPLRNLAALADEKQPGKIMQLFSTLQLHYQVDLFISTMETILGSSCKDVLPDNVQLKDFMQLVLIEGDGTDIATKVTEHRWEMKGLKRSIPGWEEVAPAPLAISESHDPCESLG